MARSFSERVATIRERAAVPGSNKKAIQISCDILAQRMADASEDPAAFKVAYQESLLRNSDWTARLEFLRSRC